MTSVRRALCVFAVGAGALASPARGAAPPTHVMILTAARGSEEPEVGQGVLFRRRDACFAITAAHVMGTRQQATLVGGSNADATGAGRLATKFPEPADLALLRVSGRLAQAAYCQATLEDLRSDSEQLNRGAGAGTLAIVERDGRIERVPMVFKRTRPTLLLIEPLQPQVQITEGWSGSMAFLGDVPAGIMLRKFEDNRAQGVLVTMQHAIHLVEQWFDRPDPTGADAGAHTFVPDDGGGNLLARARGAQVVEWNVLPASPENGAEELLLGTASRAWVAHLDGRRKPAVVLRMAAEGAAADTVARVEIDLPTKLPPAQWPSELEVQFSASGDTGSWRTFGETVLVRPDESRKVIVAAPVRARYLRLLLHRNFGDPSWVGVGALRAYATMTAGAP